MLSQATKLIVISTFVLFITVAMAKAPTDQAATGKRNLKPKSTGPQQDKTIIGGFKNVSGMDSETEVVEFREGSDMPLRKRPGRTRARIKNGSLYLRTNNNRYVRVRNGRAKLRNGKVLIIRNFKIIKVR